MQERNVVLTWEAIYDVADIAEYIEAEFGMNRADRFQDDIKEQMRLLGSINVVFGRTQIYYRNYAIHKKPFPPAIIFYVMKGQEVHILRVLREERDWESILRKEQEYSYPQ